MFNSWSLCSYFECHLGQGILKGQEVKKAGWQLLPYQHVPRRRPLVSKAFLSRNLTAGTSSKTYGNYKGGEIKQLEKEIIWKELSLSHLDPQTKQCELEVQKIIHLQSLANQLPNAFSDPKSLTKSYMPTANAPIKMDVTIGQSHISNKSQPRLKRGRSVGSKDKNPRTRKGAKKKDGTSEDVETLKESSGIIEISVPEEVEQVPEIH
ncbi:hypothetical protein MTR_3g087960 [Medicago truncatula]|uniref:Uncharacterized protein n=1 Tax=Medicago truncatula TaxID=3880 RepID=G7J4F2_MEDTR|nr:hypothetical protein MTR_3g087960 [Medicago truncatula]